jgi:4a-hydroxytetrahydrobiopterin dehydratase
MPDESALPDSIRSLCDKQTIELSRKSWMADLRNLVVRLEQDGVLAGHHSSLDHPSYPDPVKMKAPGLTEEELAEALKELDGWQPWTERVLREYPYERVELRRTLGFESFPEAMRFMAEATELFAGRQHHPRWGNEWRAVHIRLTTWDAGNKITRADIETAKAVDELVASWRSAGKIVL